jgi:hypothetical protein
LNLQAASDGKLLVTTLGDLEATVLSMIVGRVGVCTMPMDEWRRFKRDLACQFESVRNAQAAASPSAAGAVTG